MNVVFLLKQKFKVIPYEVFWAGSFIIFDRKQGP